MTKAKLFRWLFVLLYALIYAGFFFHRSVRPWLLGYSFDHVLLLVLLAIPFLLPWALARIHKRLGSRRFQLLGVTLGIALLLAYALTSLIYYNVLRYKPPFEPYLQARPMPLNDGLLDQLYANREKPDRPLLIVTLGGSTSVQYPEVLLAKLRKAHPEQRFELLNLAQNSYSIKHALIRYGTHFDQWKPDIVIGLFGINEMVRNFSAEMLAVGPYDDEWSHFFAFNIRAVRLPTLEYLIWDRVQYSWYRSLRVHESDMPIKQFRSIVPYQQHLHRLAQSIKHSGASGLFLTQPTLYKTDNTQDEKNRLSIQVTQCLTRNNYFDQDYPSVASLAAAMKAYNRSMIQVADQEGTALFDLDAAIPKDLQFFTDDCHWTERGTDQVAELVADALAKKGLLMHRQLEKPAQ